VAFKNKTNKLFSHKIKVGFGPIQQDITSGSRRFNIDSVVNSINRLSKKYVCDIFLDKDNLCKFNIAVIVKYLGSINCETIKQLQKNNTALIYNIVDIPGNRKDACLEEIKLMDGILVSNPLSEAEIRVYNQRVENIASPVISTKYKRNYHTPGPIKIIWDGYVENLHLMDRLNKVIYKLAYADGYNINMIYYSNIPDRDNGVVKYIKWKFSQWEDMLVGSDIAVAIKPTDDIRQQRKPPTKVNFYRAIGLPIVCTPSEADKLVIEHGKTGFFAYTEADWYYYLKQLIENHNLREQIGRAGRKYVLDNFGADVIARKYTAFFDALIDKKGD
jgi:hypothetical protein